MDLLAENAEGEWVRRWDALSSETKVRMMFYTHALEAEMPVGIIQVFTSAMANAEGRGRGTRRHVVHVGQLYPQTRIGMILTVPPRGRR